MNADNVLVSVICDVYNHESYLRDCLDGFINQKTNFTYEILIHDDASTDNSVNIIKEYVNKYPHLFKPIFQTENQYSKGVSTWYDIQIPRAKGKYIAFCEGDDYWIDPYKLQKQVDFMEANPDYSMCFHAAQILNETSTSEIIKCEKLDSREYYTNDIFPGWVIPTASVLYKVTMVKKYPKLKKIHWMKYGDIVLFLKCTHTGRVWGMEERMSVYRMTSHGAVISQSNDPYSEEKKCFHYRFLLMNFPQLDRLWPTTYIAQFYYTKFRNSKNLYEQIKNLVKSIYFSPKFVVRKILMLFNDKKKI